MTKKRKKSELRANLEADAAKRLKALTDQAANALADVVQDTSVSVHELAKLVAGGKIKTLQRTICKRLTERAERELYELYTNHDKKQGDVA